MVEGFVINIIVISSIGGIRIKRIVLWMGICLNWDFKFMIISVMESVFKIFIMYMKVLVFVNM